MPNSISGFTGPRLREGYDEGRGTWVVYRLGALFGSVGHKVKIHKINPATGKERGDIEIKDYVVLLKPQAPGQPSSSSSHFDYGFHNDTC